LVEAWLYRTLGRFASTALPPTAPAIWSESIVVRNGATVRGIRGLLAVLGGPLRIKSMRSELSSRPSTAASLAWRRGRFIVDETLRESMLFFADEIGPLRFRRGAGPLLPPGGPVVRMNSAKSMVDSRVTLASLACGAFARDFAPALPGARGTGPVNLVPTWIGWELRPPPRLTE
jgi:hypothetical protein